MPHEAFFRAAAEEAKKSLCLRDKCGAVVVLSDEIIGRGYSAPAGDDVAHRKCEVDVLKFATTKPKSDRTCCVHAEWRAIIAAVRHRGTISGSTLYFTRVDSATGEVLKSGEPYCTVCSRLALDTGVAQFALWHESGMTLYDTLDYNERSYRFHL